MGPVELDGCRIVLLSEPPYKNRNNVLHQGIGEYDGEAFVIRDGKSGKVIEVEVQKLKGAVPITGKFVEWYLGSDFYIVA